MADEINIIGFLNTAITWLTVQEKQEMLDYFCLDQQYQENIDDGLGGLIPNPQSKSSFFNRRLTMFIRNSVKAGKQTEAEQNIIIEELDI